jgi:probable H4MPT-linked C1 transfer pathway protein
MSNPWVGLDIGGANLKAAHSDGWTKSMAFPMWKQFRTLAASLAQLLDDCPAFCGVALTMTGELADCFATRAEGVACILEQVTSVLPSSWVRVYSVEGSWATVPVAARAPWSVAASNWHGLARFCQRYAADDDCLLIDIGSTTTDLIPLNQSFIPLAAKTDLQRLQTGSLVYTGVERSNVVGIAKEVALHGSMCPIINELFATTRDVHIWLGNVPENPECCDTADQQPATRCGARHRLARIIGEDGSTLTDSDIDSIAIQIARAQETLIASKLETVLTHWLPTETKRNKSKREVENAPTSSSLGRVKRIILSGHGDFLIEAVLRQLRWTGELIRLQSLLGTSLSRCAPAYAIAILASEEISLDAH